MTAAVMSTRPLAIRVLRVVSWISLGLSVVALGIGAILGFDALARIWLAVGLLLLVTAIASFFGTRPTRTGMVSALVACTLMILFPLVGTVLTFVIAILASQTWPQLRDYYRLRRAA